MLVVVATHDTVDIPLADSHFNLPTVDLINSFALLTQKLITCFSLRFELFKLLLRLIDQFFQTFLKLVQVSGRSQLIKFSIQAAQVDFRSKVRQLWIPHLDRIRQLLLLLLSRIANENFNLLGWVFARRHQLPVNMIIDFWLQCLLKVDRPYTLIDHGFDLRHALLIRNFHLLDIGQLLLQIDWDSIDSLISLEKFRVESINQFVEETEPDGDLGQLSFILA